MSPVLSSTNWDLYRNSAEDDWASFTKSLEEICPEAPSFADKVQGRTLTPQQKRICDLLLRHRGTAVNMAIQSLDDSELNTRFCHALAPGLWSLVAIASATLWATLCQALPHMGDTPGALVVWILALAACLAGALWRASAQGRAYFLSAFCALDLAVLAVLCAACWARHHPPHPWPVLLLAHRGGVVAGAVGLSSQLVQVLLHRPGRRASWRSRVGFMKCLLWGLFVAMLGGTVVDALQTLTASALPPDCQCDTAGPGAARPVPLRELPVAWQTPLMLVWDALLALVVVGVVAAAWYRTRPPARRYASARGSVAGLPTIEPECPACVAAIEERALCHLEQCEIRLLLEWEEGALHDLEEKVESSNALLMAMSHELRTPIAGIVGSVNLLQQMSPSGDQEELLDAISSGADMLSYQVTQVRREGAREQALFIRH